MAILNYSNILAQGGGLDAFGNVQRVQQNMANLEARQLANEQSRMRLDALKGLGAQQEQQQMREQQLMQQAQEVFKNGTVEDLASFSLANPELGEAVFKARGIVDNDQKQRIANRFSNVYSSANPRQALEQEIEQGIEMGLDMSDSIQMLESDASDDELRNQAGIMLATVDPEKQKAIANARSIGEPEPLTEYQQGMLRGKEIDQQLRQQEIDLRKSEAELRKAKSEDERARKQLEVERKQQQLDEVKAEKASSLNASLENSSQLLRNVEEILGNESYIEDLTGYSGRAPTITTSGRDADVVFDQLVNSLTLDNLGLMSGVLTDRDIAVLRSAASGLERGMSKDKFKSRLRSMKSRVESKIEQAKKQAEDLGVEVSQPQQQAESDEDILSRYGVL